MSNKYFSHQPIALQCLGEMEMGESEGYVMNGCFLNLTSQKRNCPIKQMYCYPDGPEIPTECRCNEFFAWETEVRGGTIICTNTTNTYIICAFGLIMLVTSIYLAWGYSVFLYMLTKASRRSRVSGSRRPSHGAFDKCYYWFYCHAISGLLYPMMVSVFLWSSLISTVKKDTSFHWLVQVYGQVCFVQQQLVMFMCLVFTWLDLVEVLDNSSKRTRVPKFGVAFMLFLSFVTTIYDVMVRVTDVQSASKHYNLRNVYFIVVIFFSIIVFSFGKNSILTMLLSAKQNLIRSSNSQHNIPKIDQYVKSVNYVSSVFLASIGFFVFVMTIHYLLNLDTVNSQFPERLSSHYANLFNVSSLCWRAYHHLRYCEFMGSEMFELYSCDNKRKSVFEPKQLFSTNILGGDKKSSGGVIVLPYSDEEGGMHSLIDSNTSDVSDKLENLIEKLQKDDVGQVMNNNTHRLDKVRAIRKNIYEESDSNYDSGGDGGGDGGGGGDGDGDGGGDDGGGDGGGDDGDGRWQPTGLD